MRGAQAAATNCWVIRDGVAWCCGQQRPHTTTAAPAQDWILGRAPLRTALHRSALVVAWAPESLDAEERGPVPASWRRPSHFTIAAPGPVPYPLIDTWGFFSASHWLDDVGSPPY